MEYIYRVTLNDGQRLYYKSVNIAMVLYYLTNNVGCLAIDIAAIEKVKRVPKDEILYIAR